MGLGKQFIDPPGHDLLPSRSLPIRVRRTTSSAGGPVCRSSRHSARSNFPRRPRFLLSLSTTMGNFRDSSLDLLADTIDLSFRIRFGCMDADDDHSLVRILVMPVAVPGIVVNAVDASESPEVQDHDFAAEV